MIDQDKMRALVAKLRGPLAKFDNFAAGYSEAADAIDLLLAELEAANSLFAEMRAYLQCVVDSSMSRNNSQNLATELLTSIEKLLKNRAELEAAAADKRDAGRYRWLRDYPNNVNPTVYGVGLSLLRQGKYLDDAIDAALAQRQGEK